MKSIGIQWNAMECNGIPRIHLKFMEFHGILWNSNEFNEILWNPMEFHWIPWNSIVLHGIHGNSVEFHAIPWNSIEFHGSPWDLMDLFAGFQLPVRRGVGQLWLWAETDNHNETWLKKTIGFLDFSIFINKMVSHTPMRRHEKTDS